MAKESLTNFDVTALTRELRDAILGFHIANIYQIDSATLLLKLRRPRQPPKTLLIEAGRRMHLTAYKREKPPKPPAFCMALRKHLRRGRIIDVQQHDFDRIVSIHVEGQAGRFQLVSELFGDGNIILVDMEGRILQALRYRRMSHRNIIRGEVFKYPPSSPVNPLTLTIENLEEIREYGDLEVVRGLVRHLGISGLYAEEILLRAEVDKKKPCQEITDEELQRIHMQTCGLASAIRVGSLEPQIVVDGEEWVDVVPVKLQVYANLKSITFESFNQALDEYFTKLEAKRIASTETKGEEEEKKRLERVLEEQREALEEFRRKAEDARKIGDKIYTHLGELSQILHEIRRMRAEGIEWTDVEERLKQEAPLAVLSISPAESSVEVDLDGLRAKLDFRLTAQENASKYYEEAKKWERKAQGAEKAMKKTLEELEKVESRIESAKAQKPKLERAERRKRAWYEQFRWFQSSEGILVVAGKDAKSNVRLARRRMEPSDIVLHAEIAGAPLVLVKNGEKAGEKTIREAAQFAASHSRAWKMGLNAIDVYWVRPEQVKLSAPSGQYLPKGALMIHGKRNYIRGVSLRLAFGILRKNGEEIELLWGPAETIKEKTPIYVAYCPGNTPARVLAEQIRKRLMQIAPSELRKKISQIPPEEFRRRIPYGTGRIVSS